MKILTTLLVLSFIIVGLMFTGFQCRSPEMTSAKLYLQRKDWANAEKSLIKEVEKHPENAEAWYLLGDTRREMGNFEGMMTAFDNSLKNSQEFAEDIKKRKLFVWQTAVNAGVNFYNKSITASPDSATLLRQKAINAYKVAILVQPDSVLTYENMSIAYLADGNKDEAIHYLKEVLKRKNDPNSAITLINIYLKKAEDAKATGNNSEAMENYNNAIEAIKDALSTDTQNTELLRTLIDVYIAADRAEEGMPYMIKALQNDPNNKTLRNNLGLLLMKTEQIEKSIEQFDAAIASDSTYEDGLWNGAIAYMRWGEILKKRDGETDNTYLEKFKISIKLIEKLISIKSDEAKYWDGLATAYANAGMAKQAQKAFEMADQLRKQ